MPSRILIVDDDSLLREMATLVLTQANYEVRSVPDGYTALEMVQEWSPNLILLDIMMPGMDGIETLNKLRVLDQTIDTPVILLTAKGGIEDKTAGFDAQADDYITKPFNNDELKLRVKAHLLRIQIMSERDHYEPEYVVKLPIVLSHNQSGIFRISYRNTKRLFDIIASSIALIFLFPVMLAIAAAIRLESPGPIVFSHQRVGSHGQLFRMLKFRTMYRDAEEMKKQLMHLNEMKWPAFKITNDPRITKVGKFLRRTSLDELPQLINVIKGDMSLVGPRPHSWGLETYQLWQTERLEVRPGITGLWQISGRNEMDDFSDWVELDIEYIERQSWQLDFLILFQTFAAVLSRRGAH